MFINEDIPILKPWSLASSPKARPIKESVFATLFCPITCFNCFEYPRRQFYRVRFHVTSWLQLVLWIFKFSVVSVFGWKLVWNSTNITILKRYMTFDSLSKHLCLICLSAVSCWMSERKSVQVFLVRKHCRDERSVPVQLWTFERVLCRNYRVYTSHIILNNTRNLPKTLNGFITVDFSIPFAFVSHECWK